MWKWFLRSQDMSLAENSNEFFFLGTTIELKIWDVAPRPVLQKTDWQTITVYRRGWGRIQDFWKGSSYV